MKILHVLNTGRFSGAENVVCQIIHMFKNDTNVEMIYCSRNGSIKEALSERNVTFKPIENLSVKELKGVIKEVKPDIIHAHDMRASFIASLSCGKIPLISHIHNNSFASRRFSLKSISYLFAALKAKHILWVSKSAMCGYLFKNIVSKKSTVLYNIIDLDALYKRAQLDDKSYDYDVVFIGSLIFPKNPQRLISVFKKVVDMKTDVKFGIVGTGVLESEVKDLCTQLNLQDKVTFLGYQSNPLKILKDAKVMLMTSRWEGLPMCALEAMALGVPIVSTPTDGLKDLVEDGVNGFLSDNDDVLANKIIEIVSNKELRNKFSNSIKEKAYKINNVKKYIDKLSDIYNIR